MSGRESRFKRLYEIKSGIYLSKFDLFMTEKYCLNEKS